MIPVKECAGCYDDFYNRDGQRCWSAEDGKMIIRYQIHYLTPPTAKGAFTKVKKPSCYRQVNNYVYRNTLPDFVKASDLNRADRKPKGNP